METYNGHVRTPADAIILFEACRLGLLPRVQRRLSEKERQSIKSGSVFVWDEREAGMRRWTDGKSWSASRVSGSFLTYREMEGKRGGNGFAPTAAATRAGKTPDSTRGSDSDLEMGGEDGPDGYRYKPDGLMKQSFSITTSTGQHLHLISYYARPHPTAQGLNQPTNDPALRHIRPQKGMYPESTIHEQQNVPVVTRGPTVGTPYAVSPHMAGYARNAPVHPPSYAQPGYGWPPSPMSTPPNNYHYQYDPSGLPPPPPINAGHSPVHYGQPVPPPLSQVPTSTTFDRPPATLSESSLPPPPPPLQHRHHGPSNGLPQYIPNPSPRIAQAALVAHQQQPQQNHASTPPLSKIDPRLISPLAQEVVNGNGSQSRTPPSAEHKDENADVKAAVKTIPSIGSLMNDAANETVDTRSDHSGSRSGSRSPGGSQKRDGPHDIPSEKLGFGEDMRALRVLDRAFSA